ncbi:HEAT repeat domain-containing protein [Shewanella sp.]|uniref:HEAT repeat domain-containing protein n=1 Tax=Shewanella sp. TaxID=50422 RepID=UPI00356A1F93
MTLAIKQLLAVALTSALMGGCAPSSYQVTAPAPSNIGYEKQTSGNFSPVQLDDKRADTQTFSYGVLKADLKLDKSMLAPVNFLQENTDKELAARGINLNAVAAPIKVDVHQLAMRNHRTNAYTPFITFTMLSADVHTSQGTKRIGVFVKRGKVPVWSFDEIIEPTLNEPLSLLVKEFAAKLNNLVYQQQISDADVSALIARVKQSNDYLDVYQLGFGNNKAAVPYLKELLTSKDEYLRLAAISSLGNLDAEAELDTLKDVFNTADSWSDKAMAIKAIADLNLEDGNRFIRDVQSSFKDSKEKDWGNMLISLYL